jgi:hypothetical protein
VKMPVFWDVTLRSVVEIERRFRGAYCLHIHGVEGGSKYLRNVGQFLQDYMAQHPRRCSVCDCC